MYKQVFLKFKTHNVRVASSIKNHVDLISCFYKEKGITSEPNKVKLGGLPSELKAVCWILYDGKFKKCPTQVLMPDGASLITSFKDDKSLIDRLANLNMIITLGGVDLTLQAVVASAKPFNPPEAVEPQLVKMYDEVHPFDILSFFSSEEEKAAEKAKEIEETKHSEKEVKEDQMKIVYNKSKQPRLRTAS